MRFLVATTVLFLASACNAQPQSAGDARPGSGSTSGGGAEWPTSTPEARGLDPAPFEALDAAVRAGRHGYVDALLVVRDGHVVLDERYEQDYVTASAGRDTTPHQYNYRHPDFHPFPGGRDVHTLQSVTKSITASLIGIAIDRGEIESVRSPIVSFLQDYDLSGADPRLGRATLEDLLTMRTGIEWHELDRPADSTNTTIQLEGSEDWVQFTLDQPMDAEPGETWVYNSGTSHLMSAILRSATGQTATEYAEAHLFGPLGISEYHWKRTPTGLPDTEGGLYLETSDLARFGQLFLDRGTWNGERILPTGWVDASIARQVEGVNDQGWGYGYQWWRLDRDGTEIWAGLGYGGQYLLVLPGLRMVGVANSWNLFGSPEEELLPALIDAMIRAAGAGSSAAQESARPEDVASPEAVLAASYESITRRPGEPYDWARFRSLRLPDALLVPNAEQRGGKFGALTVDEFIEWIDAYHEEHAPIGGPDDRGFAEEAIHSVTNRYGDVVQVISTYVKRYHDSDEIIGRGINFSTLVFDGTRWWVASTAWDEENDAGDIPESYLP